MHNTITILIPCYNGEKFIKKCLDSCINQTYKDIKILVVNDGSNDNSETILKDYLSDWRFSYINQENKGLAKTRNVLIKNCQTDYCFFLDADDWIDNDCVEAFMQHFNNQDLIFNSCIVNKRKSEKVFYISNRINKTTNKFNYIRDNTFFAWNILFNKNYVINNNLLFYDDYSFFEDAGTILMWILKSNNISFINNPKYHYNLENNESLSHTKISEYKIHSAIKQLSNLYQHLKAFYNNSKINKSVLDQLVLYHCIIFTYIQFQSNLNRKDKKKYKQELKLLENNNWKLKFPKRYWKFWYFVLYKLYLY